LITLDILGKAGPPLIDCAELSLAQLGLELGALVALEIADSALNVSKLLYNGLEL